MAPPEPCLPFTPCWCELHPNNPHCVETVPIDNTFLSVVLVFCALCLTLKKNIMNEIKIDVTLGFNPKFWALLPAVNLNFCNGFTFEIEFLCFSFYADFEREDNIMKKYYDLN